MSEEQITIWQIGSEDFFRYECLSENMLYGSNDKPQWICLKIKEAIAYSRKQGCSPQIIVLLQQYPDEYLRADVEALMNEFPISRIVAVYGPWCEGDGRNRNHLPLGIRTPISLAAQRINNERLALQGKRNLLPVTASRDEIFESSLFVTNSETESNAVIISGDRIFADCVSDMISKQFSNVSAFRSITEFRIAKLDTIDQFFVDVDPYDFANDDLKEFCDLHKNSKLIALSGFDYPDFVDDLMRIGFQSVVSKLSMGNSIFAGA